MSKERSTGPGAYGSIIANGGLQGKAQGAQRPREFQKRQVKYLDSPHRLFGSRRIVLFLTRIGGSALLSTIPYDETLRVFPPGRKRRPPNARCGGAGATANAWRYVPG